MDNRAGEMEVFAAIAERGSFSAAGRLVGLSPSAVSKLVSRLEDRLGTRLLVRSTRALQLTPEGQAYLARARRILAEIDETERVIAGGAAAAPKGRLKVSASVAFAAIYIVPLVPAFLEAYPQVELDLSLSDSMIDLIDERADIAVRTGPMPDSALKARKLIDSRWVVVASPEYLARYGTPETPDDLADHNCMLFNLRRNFGEWPFLNEDGASTYSLPVSGNFLTNNGLTMRRACLQGIGIARIAEFDVASELESGALVRILEDHVSKAPQVVHAVYAGHDHMAARIRAFIDFMAEHLGNR